MADPESVVTRYWMPAAIGAMGTIVAAVSAVFAASALNDDSPSEGPANVLITASSTPAGTVVLTDPPTPSPTAAPGGPPDDAIVAGNWEFRYTVLTNDCPFGTPEGGRIDYALQITEGQFDDGYIEEGEDAAISDQGVYLGRIELTYPNFDFNYPINAFGYTGTAEVSITFDDSESGHGFRRDRYDDGAGATCQILARDD
jgi:hypothetical protein